MAFIGTIAVGFIVISLIFGAIKGFSSSVKENGPRHKANFESNSEHLSKRRTEELLSFLDSLEARNYILFVHNKQDRLFTIVYIGGSERESLDIQIIDNDTIKIDSYKPIDYKGYLGVLKSPDIGKSMYDVLSDLYKKNDKPVTIKYRN